MTNLTAFNTTDPAIYISMEFSDDYCLYDGTGTWKWVAKRSWSCNGATRIEILEIPESAHGADKEDVVSLIQTLTRAPEGSDVKYAVSKAGYEEQYIAVRIE